MPKFPYVTSRKGSANLYYKRDVPKELQRPGRPGQLWVSLKTTDLKAITAPYAKAHADAEAKLAEWRREDAGEEEAPITALIPTYTPTALSPKLLKDIADRHYAAVIDDDFDWRGGLWARFQRDPQSLWRGDLFPLPKTAKSSTNFWDILAEEGGDEAVFDYAVYRCRADHLAKLRSDHRRGTTTAAIEAVDKLDMKLEPADRRKLEKRLLEAEIAAVDALVREDASRYEPSSPATPTVDAPKQSTPPGGMLSVEINRYLAERKRAGMGAKTMDRIRKALHEFVAIAGDKPINRYTKQDGVRFKVVQEALPAKRQVAPFKGLSVVESAELATKMRTAKKDVKLLDLSTIKDKFGFVRNVFKWAQNLDESVVNPVEKIEIAKKKNKGKRKRSPWTIEELNRLFSSPIYTGCKSKAKWSTPGTLVLRQSAMFWVPLIGLFTGMRLGEIIQAYVSDVLDVEGVLVFDVTMEGDADDGDKSTKTTTSKRYVPVHQTLLDCGFNDFLELRRQSKASRLFPDYKQSTNGSWSRSFGAHFKRHRESIGVPIPAKVGPDKKPVARGKVDFHSLRHNHKDALRNGGVMKDIRDAIHGRKEDGTAAEYGTGFYAKTLNEGVQKIKYDGLKLDHLIMPRP